VLDVNHQYTRLVQEQSHELVAQIRRCGREAGKRMGYKIRTLTSHPQSRDDESQSGSSPSIRIPPTRIASASETSP
jgi:hypothetical protein